MSRQSENRRSGEYFRRPQHRLVRKEADGVKRMLLVCAFCLAAAWGILAVKNHRDARTAPAEDYLLLIEEAGAQETAPAPVKAEKSAAPAARTVRLLDSGSVRELQEEEYLTEVLLCEMPADFEPEALKAQAVAARTFLHKKEQDGKHQDADVCSDSACCQAWTSREALKKKLGAAFEADYRKAQEAVLATRDEVLVYDGNLIDATFFSCSGGSTESAAAVWGSDVPYLQSVRSPGEEDAARYESSVSFSPEDFKARLCAEGKSPVLSGSPEGWIGDVQYTDGGGVAEMEIGGVQYSGVELRRLLGLNSTKFTVSVGGKGFSFDVLGYGHRVGMSQYGANEMAQNGFSCETILLYYYRGAKIKSLSQISLGQAGTTDTDIKGGSEQTSG